MNPHVELLLSSLSAVIGHALEFGEEGECALEFDDDVEVVLSHGGEPEALCLRSALTFADGALDAAGLQEGLSMNYSLLPPGFRAAIDPQSHRLVLVAMLDAATTSPEHFLDFVAGFLELVPLVRSRLGASLSTPERSSKDEGVRV